ncbi:Sulfate transporter like protein [Argiope bruennichi]|uniref:Sulfate transporter like protein n=1 Tax=Argiope bruennichi TaxID=94029 RepID=A0A8T0EYH3_ARGBR|nr:Sulfate transporter like protein [Argiope bruennichi]
MADKLSAANHDAKEYGTFNSQDSRDSKNEKQQVLDSYLSREGRGAPSLRGVQAAFSRKKCGGVMCGAWQLSHRSLPPPQGLPDYSIKNDLFLDVLTGITLLILHVPQGMAYAQLASVSPIYGLYTSFYPVLIYILLGTSKHVSIGTFAISSLLAGTEVDFIHQQENMTYKVALDHRASTFNMSANGTLPIDELPMVHEKIHIAMILTFMVGILQVRRSAILLI